MKTGMAAAAFPTFARRVTIGGAIALFLSFVFMAPVWALEFKTSPEPLVIETG